MTSWPMMPTSTRVEMHAEQEERYFCGQGRNALTAEHLSLHLPQIPGCGSGYRRKPCAQTNTSGKTLCSPLKVSTTGACGEAKEHEVPAVARSGWEWSSIRRFESVARDTCKGITSYGCGRERGDVDLVSQVLRVLAVSTGPLRT